MKIPRLYFYLALLATISLSGLLAWALAGPLGLRFPVDDFRGTLTFFWLLAGVLLATLAGAGLWLAAACADETGKSSV